MELMDAVDSWIPEPVRDQMPALCLSKMSSISGRGTVATGW